MRILEIEGGIKRSFIPRIRQVWPDGVGSRAIAKEGKAHG
jgi:hypothetical protein